MLHSSGDLLLSLVNLSNTLDHYAVMIDCQNVSSGYVNRVQKRDEQTMDSLQPRDQVVGKRAEPDEKRAADSSLVRCRSVHPDMSIVSPDDPNEEITEQWQDCLHDGYTCRDDQCSTSRTECPVVSPRGDGAATSVRVSNAVRYRRHVNVEFSREIVCNMVCVRWRECFPRDRYLVRNTGARARHGSGRFRTQELRQPHGCDAPELMLSEFSTVWVGGFFFFCVRNASSLNGTTLLSRTPFWIPHPPSR